MLPFPNIILVCRSDPITNKQQLGLSVVPFLPYIFDHPVDEAVDWLFRTGIRAYAGEDAVQPLPRHSEARGTVEGHDEDATSLTHLRVKVQDAVTGGSTGAADASWEEYKAELQRAKEQRKLEREARGETGILAMLGFGSSNPKDKTE
jgi:fission process protein 1